MTTNKHFTGKSECPYCSKSVDSAIGAYGEDALPSVGDIALCCKCGDVSEYDKKMKLVKFDIKNLSKSDVMDIRHKQFIIAKINNEKDKLQ